MFNPNILRAYEFRIIECNMHAIDACVEVSEFGSLNIQSLAQWLRTIEAIGAHRLTLI